MRAYFESSVNPGRSRKSSWIIDSLQTLFATPPHVK